MTSALKTTIKVLLGLFGAIILSIIVLCIIFLSSDPNQYKDLLAQRVKENTGATIDVAGDFDLSIFPTPGVVMNQVNFIFPANENLSYLAKADSVRINFELLSLMTTEYRISKFNAEKVDLTIAPKGKQATSLKFDTMSGSMDKTCCSTRMPNFVLTDQGTTVKGDIEVETDIPRPLIKGKIKVSNWKPGAFTRDSAQTVSSNKVIPNTPIPYQIFESIDYDVFVSLKDINFGDSKISQGKLQVVATDGKAVIEPLAVNVWGSELKGRVILQHIAERKHNTEVDLTLNNGNFKSLIQDKLDINGGKFDIKINGKGRGETVRSVLSHFNGDALWVLKNATLNKASISNDVTSALLGFLNPFSKKDSSTQIECVVMRYNIKNGTAFAMNKLAAETNQFDVLGSGKIDLATEALDMEFNLRQKQGIDLSIGNFDKYFRLAGTLKHPKAVADPKGLLEDGLSLFGTLASGGLSLLAEQVFDQLGQDRTPCASVLEDKK